MIFSLRSRLSISASVFLLAATASVPVSALTLKEALAIAYKNNPELKAAQAQQRGRDEEMPQALSAFMPQAQYQYSRENSDQVSGSRKYNDLYPTSKSWSVVQPLFNGGRDVAATMVAKYRILAGRNVLKNVEQSVLNDAVTAYAEVIRAREVLHLSQNNEHVLEEQLRSTNERFKLGETTKTDTAQSESRLARAVSDRIRAESSVINAEANYKRIYLVDAPKDLKMPTDLPKIPEDLKIALDKSLKNNPQLLNAKFTKDASDKGIYRQVADLLPSMNARYSKSSNAGLSNSSGLYTANDSVSLNVTVPLFQGGGEYSQVRAARQEAQRSEDLVEDTYNRVIENATSSWQGIADANATVESRSKAVEAAAVALDGVRQEREIGTRTTLDVLDAEQELFVAKVDLVTAKRNKVVSVYNLLASMGEMTAQDIGLDVPYYDSEKNYNKVRFEFVGF